MEQLTILIKGQDEISKELDKISGKLDGFVSSNQRQTKKLNESWESNINTLIAVGNIASTVDNIFSSLTNLEIRLENATERLANAQDTLTDATERTKRAQQSLNDIQKNYDFVLKNNLETTEFGQRVLEEYEKRQIAVVDARKQEERATRGLTIAQNGLDRAQNQVLGTYINVGVQTASLTKSLGGLGGVMGAVGGPYGAILVGGLLAVGLAVKDNEEVMQGLNDLWNALGELWITLQPIIETIMVPALNLLLDVIKSIVLFLTDLIRLFEKVTSFGGIDIAGKTQSKVSNMSVAPMMSVAPNQSVNVSIGNVFGTSPSQLSTALKSELSKKIKL